MHNSPLPNDIGGAGPGTAPRADTAAVHGQRRAKEAAMGRKMSTGRRTLLTMALAGGLTVKRITGSNALALLLVDTFLKEAFRAEKKKGAK
jgi:hypothetical protein